MCLFLRLLSQSLFSELIATNVTGEGGYKNRTTYIHTGYRGPFEGWYV
jgi:hypothetical protein